MSTYTGDLGDKSNVVFQSEFSQNLALLYFVEGLLVVINNWITTENSLDVHEIEQLIITLNKKGVYPK